jgi:cytoskeletal protein RodZ
LAEDIEANGGICKFKGKGNSLATLLDKRKDQADNLYGPRGSILRKRLQQKVYTWQLLYEQGLYLEKVLNVLGVVSFNNRTGKKNQPSSSKPAQSNDDISVASSADSSSSSSHSPKLHSTFKSPPGQVNFDPSIRIPITPLSPPRARVNKTAIASITRITKRLAIDDTKKMTRPPNLPFNCCKFIFCVHFFYFILLTDSFSFSAFSSNCERQLGLP